MYACCCRTTFQPAGDTLSSFMQNQAPLGALTNEK